MKKLTNILLIMAAILILGIIGCRSLLDEVTPAAVNQRILDYSGVEDVGFPTLADVKRIKTEVVINHRDTQINLKRLAENDVLAHKDALAFIDASIAESSYIQSLMVGSETQPISILGLLAPLGIGTALGRKFFKRPGDLSPDEVEA